MPYEFYASDLRFPPWKPWSKQSYHPCSSGHLQDKRNAARGLLRKGKIRVQFSPTTTKACDKNLHLVKYNNK